MAGLKDQTRKAPFDKYIFEIVRRLNVYYRCTVDYPQSYDINSNTDGITVHFTEVPCLQIFLSNWFLQQVREGCHSYISAAKTVCKEIWEIVRYKLLTQYLYKNYLHEPLLREINTRTEKSFMDKMNRL